MKLGGIVAIGIGIGLAIDLSSSEVFAQPSPPPLPPPPAKGDVHAPPSSTAAAEPAASMDAPLDAIFLRNGGLYRGRIIEIVPEDHVTVRVENEKKRIKWSEIDRVILAPTDPGGPGASEDRGATKEMLPSEIVPPNTLDTLETGQRVRVHITSPKQVILYRRPVGGASWSLACRSPCDQDLPAVGSYRVVGNGVAQSKEIQLGAEAKTTNIDIQVKPGSAGGSVLGGFAIAIGITTAYIGLFVAASADSSSLDRYGESSTSDQDYGLIAFAIGATLTITGIFVYRSSSKTELVQRAMTVAPPSSTPWLAPEEEKEKASSPHGGAAAPRHPVSMARTTGRASKEPLPRVLTQFDAFVRVPPWSASFRRSDASTNAFSHALPAPVFPLLLEHVF